MKISEILWKVANKYLDYLPSRDNEYICDCINSLKNVSIVSINETFTFLQTLGMGRGYTEFIEFYRYNKIHNKHHPTIKSQCARYNFLMFASMYAKELEDSDQMEEFLEKSDFA